MMLSARVTRGFIFSPYGPGNEWTIGLVALFISGRRRAHPQMRAPKNHTLKTSEHTTL
jgi:hypothetical protein